MGKRVLILSTSAGTGHLRAAEALEGIFRAHPEVEQVVNVDALKFTNKLFRDFYSKLYVQMIQKAPTLLGWVYDASDEPWKTEKMRLMLDRLNLGPLIEFIEQYNPDITVCTHFLPGEIMSYLISTERVRARLSIVVTDLDCHAMWLSRTFHRYFVALEETKVHLESLGVPAERITVSGIPVDPHFSPQTDRRVAKIERGLDPDLPMFLVSAGALGVSPAESVMAGLLRLQHPAQVVVVCGKNEMLQANVAAIAAKSITLKAHVLGYTNEMHLWMAAADLFIGKPGGLTTSEALAVGLPMVIVAPIPGQEERNSDHLLEKGIAIRCNEFTTLAYKIDLLLDDPARLESLRAKAREYGRPDAAQTIVRTLLHDELFERESVTIPKTEEVLQESLPDRARHAMESFTKKFRAGFSAAWNGSDDRVP